MSSFTALRRCTTIDKALISAALGGQGIRVRVRRFPNTLRVCLIDEPTEAAREAVAQTLNAHGYLYAGGSTFTPRHFNQPHEVFVAGVGV